MADSTNVKGFTVENLRALDRILDEVPLDEDEAREVVEGTGVDPARLATRLRTRLDELGGRETRARSGW